jgi:hypothetical protein
MPLGHTVTPAVQAPSTLCPWETRPESEKHCRGARTPERRPPWLLEVPLRTRTSRYVPAGESAHQVGGLHESGREAVQEKLAGGLRAPSKLPGTMGAWITGPPIQGKRAGQDRQPPGALESRTLNHIEGLEENPRLPETRRSLPIDTAGCQCTRHLRCCPKPVCYLKHWQASHTHSTGSRDAPRDWQLSQAARTRTDRHKPG